jgi:hypothetical protein
LLVFGVAPGSFSLVLPALPLFKVHVDSFQNRGLVESLGTPVGSEGIIFPSGVPFEPQYGSDASMIEAWKLTLEALRLDPDNSTFRSEAEEGNNRNTQSLAVKFFADSQL